MPLNYELTRDNLKVTAVDDDRKVLATAIVRPPAYSYRLTVAQDATVPPELTELLLNKDAMRDKALELVEMARKATEDVIKHYIQEYANLAVTEELWQR